eukprot:scaffold20403_cov94-Skeletonema_dohrnii-CCMP3373.AAC.4
MFLNEARSRPIILLCWYNSSSVGGITIAFRDIALHSVETWRGETVDATPPPSVKGGSIFCGVIYLGKGRLDWVEKFVLRRSL